MRSSQRSAILAFLVIVGIMAGCTYQPPITEENLSGGLSIGEIPGDIVTPTPALMETPIPTQATPAPTPTPNGVDNGVDVKELPIVKVREGETVSFPNLAARDPDGDEIAYTFSSPLDSSGRWQTKTGDAGQYKVKISASDGKSVVSQDVLIVVEPVNAPPVIKDLGELTFKEGEKITLKPDVTDRDGDKVTVTYSGWMTSDTKQTGYRDAGKHEVVITASDGKSATQRTVTINVLNVNRAPVLKQIEDVRIKEGQKITVKPQATDEDGDIITYRFSSPLDSTGTWQTKAGDKGTYNLSVIASDGISESTVKFKVFIEEPNSPPVIEIASRITVRENDLVQLKPKVTDPDGDQVSVRYSGWMTSDTKQTTFDDQGEHKVTITASDGKATTTKEVIIVVQDVNRPPSFTNII